MSGSAGVARRSSGVSGSAGVARRSSGVSGSEGDGGSGGRAAAAGAVAATFRAPLGALKVDTPSTAWRTAAQRAFVAVRWRSRHSDVRASLDASRRLLDRASFENQSESSASAGVGRRAGSRTTRSRTSARAATEQPSKSGPSSVSAGSSSSVSGSTPASMTYKTMPSE